MNAAGLIHASGWIERKDFEPFCKMVARANSKALAVESELSGENGDDRNTG